MHGKMRSARPVAQLRQGRNDWYRLRNFGGGAAALYIYDEIGYWGVTASDLVEELSELTGVTAIDVHINSPGGEVFDGLAIMNSLRAHPATVTTYVDGMAASIASVIAMAGERVVMGPHSQMMIHEGSGLCIGDADEMRKMADLLDFQSDNIAGVYQAKAGGNVEGWRSLMRAETWFTAEEAVAAGLADEVAKPKEPAGAPGGAPAAMDNSWDLSVFRFAGRGEAPAPPVGNAVGAAEAAPVRPGEPEPGTKPATEDAEPNAETDQDTDGTPAGQQDTATPDTDTVQDSEPPTSEDTVPDTSSDLSDGEDTSTEGPTDDDDWAAMTASLISDDADDWSALVSNLTADPASSSADA
ncbi:head maturation protease, ClpP-related [Streptomyces sioyaensis]|uniref:head maturation protease, ClpP-related n=1 Tax=Streptomyces sioyaensis TaxID=67364 RepID=UPI0037D24E1C